MPADHDHTTVTESTLRIIARPLEELAGRLYSESYQGQLRGELLTRAVTNQGVAVNGVYDASSMAAQAGLGFGVRMAYRRGKNRAVRTDIIETKRGVKEYGEAVARQGLMELVAFDLLGRHVREVVKVIKGETPIKDDDGNVLTGQAGRTKRGLYYDHWYCELLDRSAHASGRTAQQRQIDYAIKFYNELQTGLSDDLPTRRTQLVETLDDLIAERSRFHFGYDGQPNNSEQVTAYHAMRKARQTLQDALDVAVTTTAMQTAFTAAETTVNGVIPAGSPQWFQGTNHLTGGTISNAYTRGTGDSAWSLVLSCRNTGSGHASNGKVRVELPESDDFNLVLARQSNSSVTITITRKGAGHPSEGGHVLTFTAHNHRGSARLQATITVSAPTPPPGNGDSD